jgi:hypothetical protein
MVRDVEELKQGLTTPFKVQREEVGQGEADKFIGPTEEPSGVVEIQGRANDYGITDGKAYLGFDSDVEVEIAFGPGRSLSIEGKKEVFDSDEEVSDTQDEVQFNENGIYHLVTN